MSHSAEINASLPNHKSWRESLIGKPASTGSVYTPVLISHGKFPYHADHAYGAKLHIHPDTFHRVMDRLDQDPLYLQKAFIVDPDLLKASLPADGKWVTLHPNGTTEHGHPCYIVPNGDGSHTVVAGAGGKLNGLKLTGVKDEGSYAQEAAQRSKIEREAAKQAKAQMIAEQGQAAYEQLSQHLEGSKSRRAQEKIASGREFVRAVLQAQGINPAQVLDVPDSAIADLDPKRRTQVEQAHVRGLVSYARSVTKNLTDRIVTSLESSSPEVADVAFSDLVREVLSPKHPGYTLNASQMAIDRGMMPSESTLEALGDESRLLRSDGDVEAAAQSKVYQQKLQAGAERARDQIKRSLESAAQAGSGPLAQFADNTKPVELQDAVKLIHLEKGLRELDKAHKAEKSDEARGVLEGAIRPAPTAHSPITMSDVGDASGVVTSVMDELRTRSIVTLLDASNTLEDASGSLYGHYVKARYEGLMSQVASAMPGTSLDPALVDLLGSAGGARILVNSFRQENSPETAEAFQNFLAESHVEGQKFTADRAVARATPLMEEGSKPVSADPSSPESLLASYAEVQKKRTLLTKAQEILGTAKGHLEAGAALNAAFMRDSDKGHTTIMPMPIGDAAIQCGAILGSHGLHLGHDYSLISPKSGETTLTITPEGFAKLVPKPSPELSARIDAIRVAPPTDHPVGLRTEIDAKSPLHEIATKAQGDLSHKDVNTLRRYWADSQGMPDDGQSLTPLSKAQDKVFKSWQGLSTAGTGYKGLPGVQEAQESLVDHLPRLASLNLDDSSAVLEFANTHAEALGYERFGEVVIGLTDASPKRAFTQARSKIGRLVRSIWAHTNGADEFDPESVPMVSKSWTQACRQMGYGNLVKSIQSAMLQDPRVTESKGKPLQLNVGQQKARQLVADNRRMGLALGAGSGKTAISFATYLDARKKFADTNGQDGAERTLMLVPSAVQGQFGSEWQRFVAPEHELTVWAKPGAGKQERETALRSAHVVVMTPESFRDTLLSKVAEHRGETPAQTSQWLSQAQYQEVDATVHQVLDAQGWGFDMHFQDEGHRLLSRQGKADSVMGILAESTARKPTASGKLPYYMFATADATKNDPSEARSVLSKVDPVAYPPTAEAQDLWARKYRTQTDGSLSENAGLTMRMEMMPYVYTSKADLDVKAIRDEVLVPLTPKEQGEHDRVQSAYKAAKSAIAGGKRDTQAEAILGTDNPQLYALARDRHVGDIVSLDPEGGRMQHVHQTLEQDPSPTIIFAKSRSAVQMLEQELSKKGHRVKTLTGSDSGLSKKRISDSFQKGEFDVLVASDAAEAGINLQRAKRVVNYDVPQTSKTLEQRIARSLRIGQTSDINVTNLVADCEWDRRNLARVKRKGGLREIMTTQLESADDNGHKFWKFANDVTLGGTPDE